MFKDLFHMHRSLQQLKESVEALIAQHGPDAPTYSLIFTQSDVYNLDGDNNPIYFDSIDVDRVFEEMDESSDVIYSYCLEKIDDAIRDCGLR